MIFKIGSADHLRDYPYNLTNVTLFYNISILIKSYVRVLTCITIFKKNVILENNYL